MNLRKEAEGRECQIRIPGVCNKDRATVVLCHSNDKRLLGVGMGQKVPDIFGAWGCSACHDYVDGRAVHARFGAIFKHEVKALFDDGVFRTQKILLDEGKIGVI